MYRMFKCIFIFDNNNTVNIIKFYRYTKLRMFALKLKKKLNETSAQLQSSEQEKAKLKKLITDNDVEHKSKQIRDEDVSDSPGTNEKEIQKSDSAELEVKVKNLTSDLDAANKVHEKVKELEGMLLPHSCVSMHVYGFT